MKSRHLYYAILILAVLLETSCSTSRKMQTNETFGGLNGEDFIQKVIENTPNWSVFSARTAISLFSENGKRTKVRGALTVKRNEALRLSVAPILGIEFFRLEITPAHILVIDRMNKRYMKCSLQELSGLVDFDLTYHAFQSLFLNEIFAADGHHALKTSDYRKFKVYRYSDETVIEPAKSRKIDFKFYTNPENGNLEKTQMGVKQFRLNWDYGDFSYVEQKSFPHTMVISSEGIKSASSAEINLSGIQIDGRWNAENRIPSKYREVKLAELINMFFRK